MAKTARRKIFSNISAENFVGRANELDLILRHAKATERENGLAFLATPGAGLSELMAQAYDQLFADASETVPVYFRFRTSDKSIAEVAQRFTRSLIRQIIAFRRRNPAILFSSPSGFELEKLASPADLSWLIPLTRAEKFQQESAFDELTAFRTAFSAPARSNAAGVNVFLILDDLDRAENLKGGRGKLVEELKLLLPRNGKFLLGGRRRALFGAIQNGDRLFDDVRFIGLEPLSFVDSGLLAERLADELKISINDQCRDLIAHQLSGMPVWIRALFLTATRYRSDLNSFKKVEAMYLEALSSGAIKRWFDNALTEIVPDMTDQANLIELLYDLYHSGRDRDPVNSWAKHFGMCKNDFSKMIRLLNSREFINVSSNIVGADKSRLAIGDYIDLRYQLEIRREARSLTIANSLAGFLKRAPLEMAGFYKAGAAFGVRNLLGAFDCQKVPVSLLDYGRFRDLYRGTDSDKALATLKKENDTIELPQIVYTANTVSIYEPIAKFAQREESAVALGFDSANYSDDKEVVWIAAEIDNKLEVDAKQANFWCDRLEMVAVMCGFQRYRLWLVSNNGFSDKAIEILDRRNAFGTSREQTRLLAKFIDSEECLIREDAYQVYEMVLPMSEDSELIAAYTVEEIARKHQFETKAINQIKTAIVEAYINASEHSKSPDRKIYQRFSVDDEKLTIVISNRGLRFDGSNANTSALGEGRRGWGLNLIKSLMDEVKFESVDDGTRITMVKYMQPINQEAPPVAVAAKG